jgi:hypothetical protein
MNGTRRLYSTIDFPPLTDEQKAELESLKSMRDEEIDTSEIPSARGAAGSTTSTPCGFRSRTSTP